LLLCISEHGISVLSVLSDRGPQGQQQGSSVLEDVEYSLIMLVAVYYHIIS
jgi:hypothetical protein